MDSFFSLAAEGSMQKFSMQYAEIQFYPCASSVLPCQMSFCQSAALLLSIAWQQRNTWNTGRKVQPVLPHHQHQSDVMGQDNKIEGIIFKASLMKYNIINNDILYYSNNIYLNFLMLFI